MLTPFPFLGPTSIYLPIVSTHRYGTTLHSCIAITAYDKNHDAGRERDCLADYQLSLRNTMLGPHQSVHC